MRRPPWGSTNITPRPVTDEVPEDIKDQVWFRANSRCESCGVPGMSGFTSFHHRRQKGMGGSSAPDRHSVSNIVFVCGRDNKTGCHGYIHGNPFEAYQCGWLVKQGADPARIPLTLHDGRTVFLSRDGRYEALPDVEAS